MPGTRYRSSTRSSLTLGDLTDGIHPNTTGYAKLASIWFDAIQDEVPHPSGDFIV